ncbi:hypothetical protein NXY55_25205, partial [Aeromonas veronii]|nr:hypothetical protein [Aeromonas veronii]
AFMMRENAMFSYTSYYWINENNSIITPALGVHLPNRLELIKCMSERNIINGCSVMINKTVFNHIGVFDEALLFTHDYDLWLRILQKFDFHYVSHPLLLYRVHNQMGSIKHATSIKRETEQVINRHRAKMQLVLLEQLRKQ